MVEISDDPPMRNTIASSSHESCEQSVQGKTSQHTTIEMLPEDALLEVFDIHRLNTMVWSRDGHQWDWLCLAHVSRRWRHVISISPHRLDLWILCESGAPIDRILGSWSTVPLIVRFKETPKFDSLPDNITAALYHPDRICEIDFNVTTSMAGPIVEAIQVPFQVLKSIRITVNHATRPPLLVRNAFLGGGSTPHLREIKLNGIAFPFPALREVLLSTNNLVELHLSGIPNDIYFSPDDLITGLSTLVQLERLTVNFHSPASRPPPSMNRLPQRNITLPSLTFLEFHGASEYLEEFVAQIDFPALSKIAIRFFNQIFFEIPQFCEFVLRLKALRTPTWVFVTHSAESVSVFFAQEGKPSNENSFLGTSCRRLDWQMSFVTQISNQLSPLISNVHSLSIKKGHKLPTGEEDVDSTQWLELFQPFTQVTQVHVWEKQLVPGIVQALVAEDLAAEVLPELTSLHLSGYRGSPSVTKAAEQFVDTRELSGRAVRLIG